MSIRNRQELTEQLLGLVLVDLDGNSADARGAMTQLAQSEHQDRILAAAGLLLGDAVVASWRRGWLPADLVGVVCRERDDPRVTSLLLDVVAADMAKYPAATVHRRWAAQVGELEAKVWWRPDRPHLVQWAERAGVGTEAVLLTMLALMTLLLQLPPLPRILPLPGEATRATGTATGIDQKILGRVRGLLAKAESTEYPEEAEALSAKAQELMRRHALERALLESEEQTVQTASSTRLWLEAPYAGAKALLVSAIARANRCKSVHYKELGFVALVGTDLDLEITELLVTSLLVQATRAMVAEGSHSTLLGTSRTRSFRQSFLVSYATRIGERLAETGKSARDDIAADPRLLPVLADRSKVVEDTFNEMFKHTVSRRVSVSNGAGWHAGRQAADRADLSLDRAALTP